MGVTGRQGVLTASRHLGIYLQKNLTTKMKFIKHCNALMILEFDNCGLLIGNIPLSIYLSITWNPLCEWKYL
jgi:hypothetical protein